MVSFKLLAVAALVGVVVAQESACTPVTVTVKECVTGVLPEPSVSRLPPYEPPAVPSSSVEVPPAPPASSVEAPPAPPVTPSVPAPAPSVSSPESMVTPPPSSEVPQEPTSGPVAPPSSGTTPAGSVSTPPFNNSTVVPSSTASHLHPSSSTPLVVSTAGAVIGTPLVGLGSLVAAAMAVVV